MSGELIVAHVSDGKVLCTNEDDDEERDPAGERVQLYRRQSLKKHMESFHVKHYLEDRDSLELLRLLLFSFLHLKP